MVKRHKATMTALNLPDAEYEILANLELSSTFIAELDQRHGIKISMFDSRRIASVLAVYAASAFTPPDHKRMSLKSQQDVANALDRLFSVLDAQRRYPVPDPRREGSEYFVLYSQRGYTEAETRQRSDAMFGGRDPGPPGLCRDTPSKRSLASVAHHTARWESSTGGSKSFCEKSEIS